MIVALLLAAVCVPLPTCSAAVTTGCATPSAVLQWDRVPDKPPNFVKGYKVYYRYPGGTWQLVVDLPCQVLPDIDEDGVSDGVFCPGADGGYAVQRWRADEFLDVEYSVRAYDDVGALSPDFSTAVSVCPSHVWIPNENYQ